MLERRTTKTAAPLVLAAALLGAQSPARFIAPQPAAEYITLAFDRYPLVAFSEPAHGAAGTQQFLASLIRQPGFAGKVTDIVIECGNARYQAVADRYFAGEPVDPDELRQIWENTTIVSGVWQLPVYANVLADIRAFNLTLPRWRRIRVLLGDPPIDWSLVRGPADEDMNDWRDAHFARVVEDQVIGKGGRALLWIGGAHTSRRVVIPDSLIHLLDRRLPGRTLVVHSVSRDLVSTSVRARIGAWPALSAFPVRGTWIGRLDVGEIGHGLSRGIVEDDLDALVFWSDVSPPDSSPAGGRPVAVSSELRRRQRLADATLPFRGGRIRFEADSSVLARGSEEALQPVVAELERDTALALQVKAFADARERNGSQLSVERAQRVVNWLTSRGVDPKRLVARGCAASRAIWNGDTEEERAANRRAELVRDSPLQGCQPPFVLR